MNYLAKKLAHMLFKYANGPFFEDEIRYGIEIALGALFQIVVILVVAQLLGVGQEVLAIIITAVLYRRYTGGPHCSTYYRCTITSLITFITLGFLTEYIPADYLPVYIICLAIGSVLVIKSYVPVDNPINVFTDELRKKKKQQSGLILLLLQVIIVIGYLLTQKLIVISILLGLLWQNFTLMPFGQTYVHLCDQLFDRIEELFKGEEVMKC